MSDHTVLSLGVILIFSLLIIYMFLGAIIEHKHPVIGHETGIIIIISMIISYIASLPEHTEFIELFAFSPELFFYVVLPPILFAAAFNMRRKKFFDNMSYILIFGIFSTLTTFIIFTLLFYGSSAAGLLYKFENVNGKWEYS